MEDSPAHPRLALAAVLVTAFAVRPVVTVVSATLGEIHSEFDDDLGVSLLTAAPMPAFALAALMTGWLATRLGVTGTMLVASSVLAVTLAVRPAGSLALLVACSLGALFGNAVQTVLLPSATHKYFPRRYGAVTGAYGATMSLASAVASATAIPLAGLLGGWRGVLWAWAPIALAAAALWLPLHVRDGMPRREPRAARGRRRERPPLRYPRTLVMLFATQAAVAFSVMGWLPTILSSAGVADELAGLALAGVLLVALPASAAAPLLISGRRRRPATLALSGVTIVGLVALMLAPQPLLPVAVVALGVGSSIFPVSLVLITEAAGSPTMVARISSRVQGYGYALAAPVPFATGLLAGAQGWTVSLAVVVVIAVAQVLACWQLTAPRRDGAAAPHDC